MEELLVLALLVRWPMTGSDLLMTVNRWLGPHHRLGVVPLHRLLARLESEGLLRWPAMADDAGATGEFVLTERGQERLRELMLDQMPECADHRQVFQIKAANFDLLDRYERITLIEGYRRYCERSLEHLRMEREQLTGNLGAQMRFDLGRLQRVLGVMSHMARSWESEIAWADDLRRLEEAGLAVAR